MREGRKYKLLTAGESSTTICAPVVSTTIFLACGMEISGKLILAFHESSPSGLPADVKPHTTLAVQAGSKSSRKSDAGEGRPTCVALFERVGRLVSQLLLGTGGVLASFLDG